MSVSAAARAGWRDAASGGSQAPVHDPKPPVHPFAQADHEVHLLRVRTGIVGGRRMAEEGFRYDSSIFPIAGRRYGIPDWPSEPRLVRLLSGASIHEFPLTVIRFAGRNMPVSGGGYARLLPRHLLLRCLSNVARARATWPVFYCHPHELEPGEFRRTTPAPPWGAARLSWRTRIHQGLGRRSFAAKVRLLMSRFRFRSFADELANNNWFPEFRIGENGDSNTNITPAGHRL